MSMRRNAPIAVKPPLPPQLVSAEDEFASREDMARRVLTADQLTDTAAVNLKPLQDLNNAHMKNLVDANLLEPHFRRRIEAYRLAHPSNTTEEGNVGVLE